MVEILSWRGLLLLLAGMGVPSGVARAGDPSVERVLGQMHQLSQSATLRATVREFSFMSRNPVIDPEAIASAVRGTPESALGTAIKRIMESDPRHEVLQWDNIHHIVVYGQKVRDTVRMDGGAGSVSVDSLNDGRISLCYRAEAGQVDIHGKPTFGTLGTNAVVPMPLTLDQIRGSWVPDPEGSDRNYTSRGAKVTLDGGRLVRVETPHTDQGHAYVAHYFYNPSLPAESPPAVTLLSLCFGGKVFRTTLLAIRDADFNASVNDAELRVSCPAKTVLVDYREGKKIARLARTYEDILDFDSSRVPDALKYGELAQPPSPPSTWRRKVMPFLLLGLAAVVALVLLRRRWTPAAPESISGT